MGVRVGVDVGGTFTKAVAVDRLGSVVARAVQPTSHDHPDGVAAGVVAVVADLAERVGATAVELVTHSTTQAVNALLEGDVATVGVVGMAAAPHVRKARKRTTLAGVQLTDGRSLRTLNEFLDVTGGLDVAAAGAALDRLAAAGAGAIAVCEAFAPDDTSKEDAVAALAAERDLPATTSSQLSGLYGLELRTLTAALNASILPIALRTAGVVEKGVAGAGIAAPVMVMRGDGGASDLASFRRSPVRTLYSGPAASVAGALRTNRVADAVIVEVGGTSTNVAAVKDGRPALSYVQVGGHAIAVRALDVRVAGVAGGSMLRVRRRRVWGVGPRSAHIAGLPYACYLTAGDLEGATAVEMSPRAGDPADYLVLQLADGRRAALTTTCAANALGIVQPGDYAFAEPAAAEKGFAIAGAVLGLPGPEVARRMLAATSQAVGDLVAAVIDQHHLRRPTLVAVGGGAGTLGRTVAAALGLEVVIPPDAEVISSIGDALSLARAERERTAEAGPAEIDQLIAEVEAEVLAAGVSPASLDVQVTHVPERGALRAVATGALALASTVDAGRQALDSAGAADLARQLGVDAEPTAVGSYWLLAPAGRVVLLDRYGDVVLDARGDALLGATAAGDPSALGALLQRHARHLGPITLTPSAWVIRGSQLAELDQPDVATLTALCSSGAAGGQLAVIVGRS